MKKILGVSIAALLAVTPMLASATAVSPAYTDPTHSDDANIATTNPQYANVAIDTADQGHIASTAYVKGAYNSAIRAINKVASDNATAEGAGIDKTDGKFSVDVTSNGGLGFTGNGDAATLNVVGGDGIAVGAGGVAVDLTSNGGLQIDGDAKLGVKVGDGIALDSTTGAVEVDLVANGNGDNVSGLEISNSKLQVKAGSGLTINSSTGALDTVVDTTTVNVNGSGQLELANGAVTTAKIADATLVINSEGISGSSTDSQIPTALAVNTAVTNRLKNGSDSNAVAMESVVQQTVRDATTLTSNTGNTLASEKAVRAAIDTATTDMATQTGVTNTLASSYVTLYTDWANQTYTQNVGITNPGYTSTVVQIPAGVSASNPGNSQGGE